MKKIGMVSVLLLSIFAISIMPELVSTQDGYLPYVPHPDEVELSYWSVHKIAYVNVTLISEPCTRIDWGAVSRRGSRQFWADSKIWLYQGICIDLVATFEHTYELGELKFGKMYTFTFKAWGHPVERITFKHHPKAHRIEYHYHDEQIHACTIFTSYGSIQILL